MRKLVLRFHSKNLAPVHHLINTGRESIGRLGTALVLGKHQSWKSSLLFSRPHLSQKSAYCSIMKGRGLEDT